MVALIRFVRVSIPLGPSNRSKALSSPPKGPLRRVLLGHWSAKTSIIFSTVSRLSASLFDSGESGTVIGRVSLSGLTVYGIWHGGRRGCRARRWRGRRESASARPRSRARCPALEDQTFRNL